MKQISNNLILIFAVIVAALFVSSCADKFDEQYDLAVNSNKYTVTQEAGSLPVTVYCSGHWTATLDEASSWATLDCNSGDGISTIHLNYDQNSEMARSADILLKGNGLEQKITVVQRSNIIAPALVFLSSESDLANGNYKTQVAFETNIPVKTLQDIVPVITYSGGEDAWISQVTYVSDDTPADGSDIPMAHRGLINFVASANASGTTRKATIDFSVTDANQNTYGDQFVVSQSGSDAAITLPNDVVPIEGGKRKIVFSSNLGMVMPDMEVELKYTDPAIKDFISNVELDADTLKYEISENKGTTKRYATITVSYKDFAGVVTSAEAKITQRVIAQPREISVVDLRNKFSSTDFTYVNDEDHIDYILCHVVGDAKNPNMEQNINTGPNSITTSQNDCTNYVQSMDGKYGFRLQFASKEANTCSHGQCVKILLDGVTLSRSSNPMCYTLRNIKAENIKNVVGGAVPALQPKRRTIASLTDDDMYTYCTLSDVEFSIKEGTYTNVREYDAIENPYSVSNLGGQAQKAKDGAVNLLHDADNKAIYMLVNMNCQWRRAGSKVPQGVGSVGGIVVHTPMERWGGDVGRYSIRPLDVTDIDIANGESSSFTKIAEWCLDKQSVSVGVYKWNDGKPYIVGNATNSDKMLVQNRMHATTDNSGGGARLYSENRMLNQNPSADRQYPMAIANGYRGLNISNYASGDGLTYGMSKFTSIAFYGNVAGWYDWNGTTWAGTTNGIVMELSTTNISGTMASVGFSIAAGRHGGGEAYCSWTNNHSFPVYWKVDYATSTNNGTTWSEYTEAVNAATGGSGFEMRSLPWCINNGSIMPSIHSLSKESVSTNSDFGFGFVPHCFVLPAQILGKSKVKIRITPRSDIISAWNDTANYDKGQTSKGMRISKTYQNDVSGSIYLEDLVIQYK